MGDRKTGTFGRMLLVFVLRFSLSGYVFLIVVLFLFSHYRLYLGRLNAQKTRNQKINVKNPNARLTQAVLTHSVNRDIIGDMAT